SPAALAESLLQEERRNALRRGTCQHRERQRGETAAGEQSDGGVTGAPGRYPSTGLVGRRSSFRQPTQSKQEEDGRHDLDHELRQRKVGRREPDERQACDESADAQQDECRESVEL